MNNIDEAHYFDESRTFFTYSKQISMSHWFTTKQMNSAHCLSWVTFRSISK